MNRRSPRRRPSSSDSNSNPLGGINFSYVAILAAVLVVGIGIGVTFSSSASLSPDHVASKETIDRSVPDAEFCAQYGASAIVSDLRVYLSLSPFSVYVTQPVMQPGCVVRRSNMTVLEKNNLVTPEQVRDCKQRFNTFGFTGKLEGSPKLNCIYQNDSAGNLFSQDRSGFAAPRAENDDF